MNFFDYFHILWTDLVDITILFLLIYNIILLLQGTRSVQILIGFTALVGLFYAARFLELNSTLWILKNFFQYIVIITIIIFQTDIRNTLANFGRTRVFKKNKTIDIIDIIRLTRTVEIAQQTNTGIILVFEQQIGLGEYVKTGVSINGMISSPLLLSIFNTKSPIHDGAVIIDTNFSIAAKAFYPLLPELACKVLDTEQLFLSEINALILVVMKHILFFIKEQ